MSVLEKHKRFVTWAEGSRNFPYEDSVGKLTIGVGRNLEDRGISDEEVAFLLSNDQQTALNEAEKFPWWGSLDPVRQLVVLDMVFNLGATRFRGFIRTIEAIERGDYASAAKEMQDSKWFRQTGRRAAALVRAMYTGELDESIYH